MKTSTLNDIGNSKDPQEFLFTENQVSIINSLLSLGLSFVISPKIKRKNLTQLSFENIPTYATHNIEEKLSSLPLHLRVCFKILNKLKTHPRALPFLNPVDPELLGIPDYFIVIKEPMDFSRIEKKLFDLQYKNHEEFERDVMLVYQNAKTYNDSAHFVHVMACEMEIFTSQLLRVHHFLKKAKTQKKLSIFSKVEKEFAELDRLEKGVEDVLLENTKKVKLAAIIRDTLPKKYIWEICRIMFPELNDQTNIVLDLNEISAEKFSLISKFLHTHSSLENNIEPENVEIELNEIKEEVQLSPVRKESLSAYWNSPERELRDE